MPNAIGWPLVSNVIRRGSRSNIFGMVRKRRDGSPKPHQGWDFTAAVGTACYAVADGLVSYSQNRGDFGLIIVHSFVVDNVTYYAAYAHMQTSMVNAGDTVMRGQQIGTTGKSGNASSLGSADMHLHFETRTIASPGLGLAGRVDPATFYGSPPMLAAVAGP